MISKLKHWINEWLIEREIHQEAWTRAKHFGVERGSNEYNLIVNQVTNEIESAQEKK